MILPVNNPKWGVKAISAPIWASKKPVKQAVHEAATRGNVVRAKNGIVVEYPDFNF